LTDGEEKNGIDELDVDESDLMQNGVDGFSRCSIDAVFLKNPATQTCGV
jgi:hypothetical protein